MLKALRFDASITVGWQQMKNEQCETKPTESKFMKLFDENGSIRASRRKKNSWITAQEFCCFQGLTNSKHPGSLSSHFVHSHSCLQSFKCPDHLVQIITHSDLLSLLFNLFHLHSTLNKALSGGLVIYFLKFIRI